MKEKFCRKRGQNDIFCTNKRLIFPRIWFATEVIVFLPGSLIHFPKEMTHYVQLKRNLSTYMICNRSYWVPSRFPNTFLKFLSVCIIFLYSVLHTLSILNWTVREACQISLLNMCMEAERTAVCRARGVYLESLIKDVEDVRIMSSLPLNRIREKRIIKSLLLFVWCKGTTLSIPK